MASQLDRTAHGEGAMQHSLIYINILLHHTRPCCAEFGALADRIAVDINQVLTSQVLSIRVTLRRDFFVPARLGAAKNYQNFTQDVG